MKREWTTINKATWGHGPWDGEPDKVQWIDEATGLDCLMVRHDLGHWCGYVGVPPEHPFHGVHYDKCRLPCEHDHVEAWDYCDDAYISVHGGLTYSDFCQEFSGGDHSRGVCHIPEPGRPANVWWLGFDCAHAGDQSPGMPRLGVMLGGTYKDQPYVEQNVRELAEQLAGVK